MKRNIYTGAGALIFGLLFSAFSCAFYPEPEYGTLVFNLGSASGENPRAAALPETLINTLRYRITLSASGQSEQHIIDPGQAFTGIKLLPGEWHILAEAFTLTAGGLEDQLAGTGAASVVIRAGEIARADINMTVNKDFIIPGGDGDEPPEGGVISVTIHPDTAAVITGKSKQFTATVTVSGSAAETVTWSVEEPHHPDTAISAGGLLTVAAGETEASLTVRVVSTENAAKFAAAAVTVIDPSGGLLVDESGNIADVTTPFNFANALVWLGSNAEDDAEYTLYLENETLPRQTLNSGAFNNKSNVSIILMGTGTTELTLAASPNGSLFTIESGVTLTLENITLKGKTGNNNASLVTVNSGGTLVLKEGGVITGNTNMGTSRSTINSYHIEAFGGGVKVASGGAFIMNGGSITGNAVAPSGSNYGAGSNPMYVSAYGGGVYVEAGGSFTMVDGAISKNTVTASATYSAGITSASAYAGGGGLYIVNGGIFSKSGGIIYGKEAAAALKNTVSARTNSSTSYPTNSAIYGTTPIGGKDSTVDETMRYNATDGWTTD
ncbi:MAG: hypothetical protein LBQ14_06355 [Treponema sp.]|nr:hypothetical protein [Treponema sp.]